jgi:hypothetical protein
MRGTGDGWDFPGFPQRTETSQIRRLFGVKVRIVSLQVQSSQIFMTISEKFHFFLTYQIIYSILNAFNRVVQKADSWTWYCPYGARFSECAFRRCSSPTAAGICAIIYLLLKN